MDECCRRFDVDGDDDVDSTDVSEFLTHYTGPGVTLKDCTPHSNDSACSSGNGQNGLGQADADGDGIPDSQDNCPNAYNPNQEDTDSDGIGDRCDNCPTVANANQARRRQ